MSATVPERTLDQRFDALALANERRLYRARLKEEIAAGNRDWREVLRHDDPLLRTMKVRELLLAIPKAGPKKVQAMMDRAGASESKTVGGLSGRQREALCTDSPLVGRPTVQERREKREAEKALKDAQRYRQEARDLRKEVDSLSRQLDSMYRKFEQINARRADLHEVAA
jgi:hypothetical protein